MYDDVIKQKIDLNIQIYLSQEPFAIGDQHSYKLKVPGFLWKMN
jgi:hypothetical protein